MPLVTLLAKLGYPRDVCQAIKGLCTTISPRKYLSGLSDFSLANIASFNLDVRLHGLAKTMGFLYSGYADDLAFSSASPAS
ncbi:MAG TPA: hypothetical protein VFM46_06900 [Pseudomonadales bacterium]|nr:hypothetical protein [Pseudomonadales bacterium]